jgi:hypothetical protein
VKKTITSVFPGTNVGYFKIETKMPKAHFNTKKSGTTGMHLCLPCSRVHTYVLIAALASEALKYRLSAQRKYKRYYFNFTLLVITQHPLPKPGLPDGFFSDQKPLFGYILEDLGMENVVMYILVIWNILRPLSIFYGHLVML